LKAAARSWNPMPDSTANGWWANAWQSARPRTATAPGRSTWPQRHRPAFRLKTTCPWNKAHPCGSIP